ncbi:hypothetical protein KC686_01660, partial [Candidatus Woesebacteria bacterium]|nr:hypothetical protein [Candidatus Woesebacteria bacterium]
NAVHGLNFPEPERFATSGEYVPSLSGEGKMSKSVVGSYISVLDDLPTIQKSLARAPTDSGTGVSEDMPVSVKNLLQLVELFQGSQRRQEYEVLYTSSGIRYGDLKKELAQAIYTELEPIQQKYRELEKSSEYVEQVIAQGAGKARQITQQTIDETKQAMGFG